MFSLYIWVYIFCLTPLLLHCHGDLVELARWPEQYFQVNPGKYIFKSLWVKFLGLDIWLLLLAREKYLWNDSWNLFLLLSEQISLRKGWVWPVAACCCNIPGADIFLIPFWFCPILISVYLFIPDIRLTLCTNHCARSVAVLKNILVGGQ